MEWDFFYFFIYYYIQVTLKKYFGIGVAYQQPYFFVGTFIPTFTALVVDVTNKITKKSTYSQIL